MDTDEQKPPDHEPSDTDKQQQTAVPYIPPPPPDASSLKRFKSPLVNGMLVAVAILLGGFMVYNYAGHQLTQLSAQSTVRTVTPTPSVSPTPTP